MSHTPNTSGPAKSLKKRLNGIKSVDKKNDFSCVLNGITIKNHSGRTWKTVPSASINHGRRKECCFLWIMANVYLKPRVEFFTNVVRSWWRDWIRRCLEGSRSTLSVDCCRASWKRSGEPGASSRCCWVTPEGLGESSQSIWSVELDLG